MIQESLFCCCVFFASCKPKHPHVNGIRKIWQIAKWWNLYAVGWSYLENGCYQLAITCNFNNRTNRWTDCHTFVSYLNDIKAWLDWLYTFVSYFRLLALILGCFTDCYVFFRMKWNQIENSSRHFPNGSVDLHDMISAVKFSLQYWTILLITGNMLKGEVCL